MNYKIWNKQENLVTPTMEVLTPQQVFEKYPAAQLNGFEFIICDSPITMGVFMEFETTKQQYKQMGASIEDNMSVEDVLSAITQFEETPQEHVSTAEERIASALEFQVMMNIPLLEEE